MAKGNELDGWAERFIGALNSEYSHDPVCTRIASDKAFAQKFARMLWCYIEKRVTQEFNRQRKVRVGTYREGLVKAIDGLESASKLYRHREPEKAACLDAIAADLGREKEAADVLLHTKRHGRDRDHGLLDVAHRELEKYLGEPVTYATLATLVSAGFQADGQNEIVDEEMIRKNLKTFRVANPNWNPISGNKNTQN